MNIVVQKLKYNLHLVIPKIHSCCEFTTDISQEFNYSYKQLQTFWMSSVPPTFRVQESTSFLDCEVRGNMFLQSTGNYLPTNTLSYLRQLKSKHQLCKSVAACFLPHETIHPFYTLHIPCINQI